MGTARDPHSSRDVLLETSPHIFQLTGFFVCLIANSDLKFAAESVLLQFYFQVNNTYEQDVLHLKLLAIVKSPDDTAA